RLYEAEFRILRLDGAVRWITARGRCYYDTAGNPTRMEGVVLDITERKRAEEELRRSEERFKIVSRATNDAVWDWDLVSNALWWNEGVQTLFGYLSEDVGPDVTWWEERIHPEDRERVMSELHAVLETGQFWSGEYRYRRADGSYADIFDRGFVIHDDRQRPVRMIGAMADITERKQAEQETQRNLERIRALHEINLAATSTLDLRDILQRLLERTGILLPYSAATVRLYNAITEELEPVACRNLDEEEWKAAVRKDSLGLSKAVFEAKTPLTVGNLRTDARVQDRSFFIKQGLTSYLALPMTVRGEILGVLGFYTQEEHEFSKEEIEFLSILAGQAAIAIQNSRLYQQTRKQADELEKANNAKSEFLSVISHELRTPLNVVMGYTAMIHDGLLGAVNAAQEQALAKVVKRSDDLLRMIGTILDATSIEAGGVKVESDEISLTHFLDELRSLYDLPLDTGVTLQWDYPLDLPVIKSDREKLRHIIQNLINNALKFTPMGSVTLSARITEGAGQQAQPEADQPLAEIGDRQDPDETSDASCLMPNSPKKWVEFTVTDTGIGISSDQLPMIFEMFHQADSSATRLHGGVGLGLYIVKKFSEMLGGTVHAESEVGKGSTFTVTLRC
ncbi:MAG: PAS domain-containing protein, partial [Candidatus Binatia bacterium]